MLFARWSIVVLVGLCLQGCRRDNPNHCDNLQGDETCVDPDRPYCSVCESEHDGCVATPVDAACLPANTGADEGEVDGADDQGSTGAGTGASTSSGTSTDAGETAGPTTSGADGGPGTSSDGSTSGSPTSGATSSTGGDECGDGVANGDEQCDGEDLGGYSCIGEGFDGGELVCNPQTCKIDPSMCCVGVGKPCMGSEDCCGASVCTLMMCV